MRALVAVVQAFTTSRPTSTPTPTVYHNMALPPPQSDRPTTRFPPGLYLLISPYANELSLSACHADERQGLIEEYVRTHPQEYDPRFLATVRRIRDTLPLPIVYAQAKLPPHDLTEVLSSKYTVVAVAGPIDLQRNANLANAVESLPQSWRVISEVYRVS